MLTWQPVRGKRYVERKERRGGKGKKGEKRGRTSLSIPLGLQCNAERRFFTSRGRLWTTALWLSQAGIVFLVSQWLTGNNTPSCSVEQQQSILMYKDVNSDTLSGLLRSALFHLSVWFLTGLPAPFRSVRCSHFWLRWNAQLAVSTLSRCVLRCYHWHHVTTRVFFFFFVNS